MSRKGAASPLEPPELVDAQNKASMPPLDLKVAKLTDTGRSRPHNEDCVDYFVPPDTQQLAQKGAIYLAADGMGGHSAGEVASHTAVELVRGHYYSDTTHDVGTSLVRAFRLANRAIYEQAQSDPSKSGMGTTLVAAVVLGRTVYIANIGDSRAYLINERGITQITEDHSWVAEQMRAGLLTKEEARRHPQRNVVTRALGSKPSVEIDLFEGEMQEGDVLLLCSDGLTGYVEDPELAAIAMEHPPEQATQLLVDQANARGGSDNISVVVVSARPEILVAPTEVAAKPARAIPLIPILAGLALVMLLAFLGLVLGPRLIGRTPAAIPTPASETPAAPAAPTTPNGTVPIAETPPLEQTVTLAPTEPGTTTEVVPPTETLPPTEAGGTEETTSTLEPTSTLESTSTVAPTFTPTPTSSPTNSQANNPKPTKTDTPRPQYAPPAQVAPREQDAQSLQGKVAFRWSFPQGLAPGEAFQVLIWQEGGPRNGAAGYWTGYEQTINLDEVPQMDQPGEYLWSVVVVDTASDERLSTGATPWRLYYIGPKQGGPGGKGPAATNPPPPDPP
jgi:serine/threonine protein phosphatase PrpC